MSFFCWRCGAFTAGHAVHLKEPCANHTHPGTASALKRLKKGMTPHPSFVWPVPTTALPQPPQMPLHIPTTSEAANDDQRSSQHFDNQSPTMQRMLVKFRTPLANSTPGTPRAASLPPHVPIVTRHVQHGLDNSQPDILAGNDVHDLYDLTPPSTPPTPTSPTRRQHNDHHDHYSAATTIAVSCSTTHADHAAKASPSCRRGGYDIRTFSRTRQGLL